MEAGNVWLTKSGVKAVTDGIYHDYDDYFEGPRPMSFVPNPTYESRKRFRKSSKITRAYITR